MIAVYAIVNGNSAGWRRHRRSACLPAQPLCSAVFLAVESRSNPRSCRSGSSSVATSVANIVGVLWAAAMFAWFFLSALYLQLVLGYSPLQVGLSFLPANLIMTAFRWASLRRS